MQHSVDTVDPNLLDLRHFPQLSASGVVEYQHDADKSQWTDKSVGDEDTVPNVPVQDSRRSSDDQLEFLGPFEFGYRIPLSREKLPHISQAYTMGLGWLTSQITH